LSGLPQAPISAFSQPGRTPSILLSVSRGAGYPQIGRMPGLRSSLYRGLVTDATKTDISDLVVIAFQDEETAFALRAELAEDAEGVSHRHGGRGCRHRGGQGEAASGPESDGARCPWRGFWGTLIGLIFLNLGRSRSLGAFWDKANEESVCSTDGTILPVGSFDPARKEEGKEVRELRFERR